LFSNSVEIFLPLLFVQWAEVTVRKSSILLRLMPIRSEQGLTYAPKDLSKEIYFYDS